MTPPLPRRLVVPDAKVTSYLLDITHPDGGPKARFFLSHGFSADRPSELARALEAHPGATSSILRSVPIAPRRSHLLAEGPLSMPNGASPMIRTVWKETEANMASLVTAYPIRARRI